MGFAVYLDQLDRLEEEAPQSDVDLLITYGNNTPIESVIAMAQKAMTDGETVRVQPDGETALRSSRVIRM